ncbi:unnamed protein product [Alternaria alternata]
MESRLLQLPGELRNRIFGYALTIDDGICYRKDKLGVGWLCLHSQPTERGVEYAQTTAAVSSDGELEDKAPARKRRKLTETVRSTTTPVVAAKKTNRLAQVTVNGHVVTNQLQFVNHQLRGETKALVIRYNDIYILDEYRHLTEFIDSVVGSERQWIQKIVRRVQLGTGMKCLSIINLYEEMHPRFMIHDYISIANLEEDDFFMVAIVVQQSGRRNDSFVSRVTQDVGYQQLYRDVSAKFSELPSYVKVFPWDRKFDEAAIRRYCETNNFARMLVSTAPNGIEGLVAIAKEWIEDGY